MSSAAHPGRHSMWGLLVSQQPATVENGLLTYLEYRQRPFTLRDANTTSSTTAPHSSRDYVQLMTLLSTAASSGKHVSRVCLERYLPRAATSTDSEGTTLLLPPDVVLVPLARDMTSIGRLISNDVPFTTNPCVSGVHCSLSLIAAADTTMAMTPTTEANQESAVGTAAGVAEGAIGSGSARLEQCRQAVGDVVTHLVADAVVGRAAPSSVGSSVARAEPHRPCEEKENAGNGKASSNRETQASRDRRVRLSDYSTNSCLINGRKIGRGESHAPLASGDVVDFMNAGPRHTTEYNLQFVYYHVDDFIARLAAESTERTAGEADKVQPPPAATPPTSSLKTAQQTQQQYARRRALLARAQWNILAQVYRMYHHDVEDFYQLDKETPLGVGGFGKVYRGALKPATLIEVDTRDEKGAASSLAPCALSLTARARRLKELAPAPAHYLAESERDKKAGGDDAAATDEVLRKTTYVQLKAQEAPPSVLAAMTTRSKRPRSSSHRTDAHASVSGDRTSTSTATTTASLPATFPFAVKLVNKQRLLLQALGDENDGEDGDEAHESAGTTKDKTQAHPRPASAPKVAGVQLAEADRETLRQLVQLETQPEDYAAQREQAFRDDVLDSVLHHLGRHGHHTKQGQRPASSRPQEEAISGDDDEEELHARKASFLFGSLSQPLVASLSVTDSLEAEWMSPALSTQAREAKARATSARLQHREELLSRLSPQLRRFYQKELQQRRRQQCEISILLAVQHPCVARLYEVFDGPTQLALVMEQATGGEVWDLLQPPKTTHHTHTNPHDTNSHAAGWDDEGLSAGGPLPEFIVKMLMVQVLEAVHYLHAMGIVHRDLKLENLLLQQPCRVGSLCAVQLNVMQQRLQDARRRHVATSVTGTTLASAETSGRVAIANPFSVLHTVHVPRAMWPLLKVTDFGLSHVMGNVPNGRQHRRRQTTTTTGAKDEDADGHGDGAPLVYARNDMTTSCGTPIYAAPEVVNPRLRPDRVGYSAAVDMYSVGVIAFALLTGRAPFPSRQRAGHGPVVDYTAPLTFERCRKVRHQQHQPPPEAAAPRNATTGAAITLPPLACVEEINVSISDVQDVPRPSSSSSTAALQEQWGSDMRALSNRIAAAEQRHVEEQAQKGASAVVGQVFDALLADTVKALDSYSEARAQAKQGIDLDRFMWYSMQRQMGESARVPAMTTRSNDTQFPLPPVSLMGQDFVRALLLARPTERLTARQALEHPWLRDCVGHHAK